jgi:hypothetical protein
MAALRWVDFAFIIGLPDRRNIPRQKKYTQTEEVYPDRRNIPRQKKYTQTEEVYPDRRSILK